MPDEPTKPGKHDRRRINTTDESEIQDWAKLLGVTTKQLKAAMKAAGNEVAMIEAYLQDNRRK